MSNPDKFSDRFHAYRPTKTVWFWSAAGVAAATMILGFTAGGWTTGGTAQDMAETAARDAKAELASAICVQQFAMGPDAANQLAELKDVSSYQRDNFIEDGGWATLASMEEPVPGAADMCADQLYAMEELPAVAEQGVAEAPAVEVEG